MTNRVLCMVPIVVWFEDWIFVREFKMLDVGYIISEVVGKSVTINKSSFSATIRTAGGF